MLGLARVGNDQRQVGLRDRRPGALDAKLFHRVGGRPQPCGIDDVQRNAADLDAASNRVARGAGLRGDDGDIFAHELVEQARLAHVGLPDEHHAESLAQQASLARAGNDGAQTLAQRAELAGGVGLAHELDVFVGKIERRPR